MAATSTARALFVAVNLLSALAVVHGADDASSTCPPGPITPSPTPPPPPCRGGNCPPGPVTPTPPPPPMLTPPPPPPPSGGGGSCPVDALRLSVCANVLNLLRLNIGVPEGEQCCPLLQGLVDLDAAVCLCIAIRANLLGIVLNIPLDLTLLLNFCDKDQAAGFTCPSI